MVEPNNHSEILQQRFRIVQVNGATEDVDLLFINLLRISLFFKRFVQIKLHIFQNYIG